jgi:ABC-type Fe3+-hydroxamate transport system substrate-binding protein
MAPLPFLVAAPLRKKMEPNQPSPISSPIVDAAGVVHRPAGGGFRIVSLVPSITELLFDLDLGEAVVGRTAFCVHPRNRVKAAKSVGGTKQVNFEKLKRLSPTHVIVNVDETPRELAEEMTRLGYQVVVTHPIDVRDNLELYRLIGRLFSREDKADALCAQFETAYETLTTNARRLAERWVLYLIWKDPWMTVSRDTYISRMLALARWQTIDMPGDARYPTLELTNDLLSKVDLVLFSSEPFPFKEHHLESFRADFADHAAKATMIDAEMVSWYGSRAISGLAYLGDFARSRR